MSQDAWRTLVATAVVAVLAALVAITGDERPAVTRAALAPGLRVADVTRVELRRGDRAVVVAVAAGGARVVAPDDGAADVSAVADLVSAVASARADRWAAHAIAAPRVTLTIVGARTIALALGDEVAATGQAWVTVDGRGALVPAWVGHALDRDPDDLRVRRLVPAGVAATGVDVHGPGVDLVLAGAALVRRDGDGRSTRLAVAARATLLAHLAALSFVRFVPAPQPRPPALGEARVLGAAAPIELAWLGPCADPTQQLVVASAGTGCVATAALDAVLAAARFAASADAIAPTPLVAAGSLVELAVAGGPRLRRDGGGWLVDDRDADGDRVDALLAALAAPAIVRPRAPLDLIGAEAWTLVDATGDAQGWRVRRTAAATTIVRDDEPVALVLDAAAAAALATVGVDLRSRQPLRLDPTRVAAIGADGVTITRGAVLGEWTASTGTVTAAAAALPALLAALQVDRHAAVATLGRVRRTLTVTIDAEPPVTVAVGAADRTGCWISLDPAAAAHVPAATCAALLAPLTAR